MNAPSPTFSVIIPVYNVEEYIAECIDSILAQSDTDFEVIIVNDGSPDDSRSIVRSYAEKDSRIRFFEQPNQGVSVARNNGISQARGRYIIHVDGDDVVHPQLLEICRHFITTYQADIVCYSHIRIAPHTGLPEAHYAPATLRHRCASNPLPLLRQRHPFRVSVMAVMACCSAEIARKHPFLPGVMYDDYPYVATMLGSVRCCVSLNLPLYGYTQRPGSTMMSTFTARNIQHHQKALCFIADSYKDDPAKLSAIAPIIFPEILKQIGNSIFRAQVSEEERLGMLRAFRTLLEELRERNLNRARGNKLRRYFAYRKILRTKEENLASIIPPLSKVFH